MKKNGIFATLDRIAFTLGVISFFCLIGSAFIQVICRYVLGSALAWPEEICAFLFMWTTYFGMIMGMNSNSHMRIDAFLTHLSPRIRWFMDLYCYLVSSFFFLMMSVLGCYLVYEIWDMEQYAISLPIPIYLVVTAIPVCFGLTGLSCINNIVQHCKNGIAGR